MAAAVAYSQPPSSTPGPVPPTLSSSNHSSESLPSQSTQKQTANSKVTRGKKERPCDACRRRKSKCVLNEGQAMCVACGMHDQKCTFVEDPRPRKRRVDVDGQTPDFVKRRSTAQSYNTNIPSGNVKIKREESGDSAGSSSTASQGKWQYHGSHVGYTTEIEPMLFNLSQVTGASTRGSSYQKSDDRNAFLISGGGNNNDLGAHSTAAVEKLVRPMGPTLLQHFQKSVSRSFPIIEDTSFALVPKSRAKVEDPALLCAIYTVAASLPDSQVESVKLPLDVAQLEDSAFELLADSLLKPTLSTIQAGLLLMQRSDVDSKTLNVQLVNAAFELGLHLDCTAWTLSDEEKGLRKRLAWALYMQDQWCSLVHGRPSLISQAHWAVQDLFDDDYDGAEISRDSPTALDEVDRGRECFSQMIDLTKILSSLLDTFYTQKAMQEHDAAGEKGTRLILQRAKPIQMRLKDWFTKLPKTLKLDNGQALSIIGHLHLAYFATEITLHRCIIRSLAGRTSDIYLTHICRSAAKTRLISAMDFVNRLRPDHLTSFWYFPSKVNFALIATFGSLLLATAPCQEEADFYKARLSEYRWTLSVSAKNAGFLNFAIESLESSTDLLKALPLKPTIDELDVRQMPPPPPVTRLIPPQQDDDDMEDAVNVHSSNFYAPEFAEATSDLMSSTGTATTDATNFNVYTGPFAELGARNWFENFHHGSPEAERMGLLHG